MSAAQFLRGREGELEPVRESPLALRGGTNWRVVREIILRSLLFWLVEKESLRLVLLPELEPEPELGAEFMVACIVKSPGKGRVSVQSGICLR